jgi:hypothetical protein
VLKLRRWPLLRHRCAVSLICAQHLSSSFFPQLAWLSNSFAGAWLSVCFHSRFEYSSPKLRAQIHGVRLCLMVVALVLAGSGAVECVDCAGGFFSGGGASACSKSIQCDCKSTPASHPTLFRCAFRALSCRQFVSRVLPVVSACQRAHSHLFCCCVRLALFPCSAMHGRQILDRRSERVH